MWNKPLLIFTVFLLFLTFPTDTLAGVSPTLLTPQDKSQTTSTKLEWQEPSYALYKSGNTYLIQIDNEISFSVPDKNTYTSNEYYSPKLSQGTWFWRVKAKDSGGTWSNWSSIWSFILVDQITSNSSATPSPLPTPAATSTPTPTPSSTSAVNVFNITNLPNEITSDQTFKPLVNLSLPNNPNAKIYLKGAFKKDGGSNYFGLTKVSGSWVSNNSGYNSQFSITTNNSGNWTGELEVKPDDTDSGFEGPGDYIFKVGRYIDGNSSVSWSNEVNINVSKTSLPTPTLSPIPSPASIITIPTPPDTPSAKLSQKSASASSQIKQASVAGIETTSATPNPSAKIMNQKESKSSIPLLGILIIVAGVAIGFYIRLKDKIKFPLWKNI
ncbi:hypothetical protein HYW42_02550 [Candidatus Daviesbacteria bacterium]|nr:hypothetical protein [Candidatus Daviesbacteria bacterium]